MTACRLGLALGTINDEGQAFFQDEAPGLLSDPNADPVSCDVTDAATGYTAHIALAWADDADDIIVTMDVKGPDGEELCADHQMILYGISGIKMVSAVPQDGVMHYEVRLPADCVHDDLFASLQECMVRVAA